jgi:DHA1 family inner membrane transport protein
MPMAIAGTYFVGEAQRKAISWSWGSMSSAGIIGIPLLTLIGGTMGWRAALIVAGIGTMAGAWFVAIALPPEQPKEHSTWRARELIESYLPLLKHPPTLRLYGVTIMRAACWIGLLTYLGSFLQEELGLSVGVSGLVYTFGGTGFALGSIVAGRQFARISPRTMVAVTNAAAGISIGAMLLVSEVWATLPLLFVTGFVSAISGVAIATMLAAESPAGAGTTMVLNGSLLNLGTAAGAIVGGALIALGGYTALGIGFPLFAFTGAALAFWPSKSAAFAIPGPAPVIESRKGD